LHRSNRLPADHDADWQTGLRKLHAMARVPLI
jgi:hypothetical protein